MPSASTRDRTLQREFKLVGMEVDGKRLGRHVLHDERSREFPAECAPELRSVSHSAVGLPLDQEDHECSTAHSVCAALNSSPVANKVYAEADAIQIFRRAAAMHGEDPDLRPGSSGLMACKAARELGLISEYRHAFGIDHALRALVLRPVMTGIAWYSSFDTPDPISGLVAIEPDAVVRGGHEVLAQGIDVDNNLVWFWNSWGPSFGIDGRFCMSFATWARLLTEDGDVTVPIVT